MSSEAERLVELMTEMGQRLGTAFGDMIPDEAQRHLLNAQRELLTALFLIYEHQLGARRRPRREREDDPFADDLDATRDDDGLDDGGDEHGGDEPPPRPPRPARSARPARRSRVDRIELE